MFFRLKRCLLGLCVLTVLLAYSVAWSEEPCLRIRLFNVGQTDSQLIVGPEKTLLIDAGSEVAGPKRQYVDIAKKVRTITKKNEVDYLLVTHYHVDHIGARYYNSDLGNGLWGLLDQEDLHVGTMIDRGDETKYGKETSQYQNYKCDMPRWLDEKKIERRTTAVLGSDQIRLGGTVKVDIVAVNGNDVMEKMAADKPLRYKKYPASENDYSVAIKVSVGKFEYFTGGDLSGVNWEGKQKGGKLESYTDLETSVADKVGGVEVMKVNHHGSSHSSNPYFINRVAPQWAVISCGENGYGHPNPDVFHRLSAGSKLLITSGADSDSVDEEPEIADRVVGKDIDIAVYDGGERYTVNGTEAKSLSEEEEASRWARRGEGAGGRAPPGQEISLKDAHLYIDKDVEVTVRGKIVSVAVRTPGPSYLNFTAQPWHGLSVVIFAHSLDRFPDLTTYKNKTVRITGKVTEFRSRPQIVLQDPRQIEVLQ